MVKNEISASTSVLSFLGSEMIKISGLVTDLGWYGLNGDLSDLKFNTMSKNVLFLQHIFPISDDL